MIKAVVKAGGKQLIATCGQSLLIEKVESDLNSIFLFDEVLSISNNGDLTIGTPVIANASVKGIIKKQGKEKKVIIFRTKAKSNWKKTKGHRQPYTRVLITEIMLDGKTIDKFDEKAQNIEATTTKVIANKETKKISDHKLQG